MWHQKKTKVPTLEERINNALNNAVIKGSDIMGLRSAVADAVNRYIHNDRYIMTKVPMLTIVKDCETDDKKKKHVNELISKFKLFGPEWGDIHLFIMQGVWYYHEIESTKN